MDVIEAISKSRSIKAYTERAVTDDEVRRILPAAVQAPCHCTTQPWCFYVMGPESRAAFGRALGHRKAKRVDGADAKDAVVAKVEASHRDLPAMLAVSMTLDENPEIREEDYAATHMAIQNLCLAGRARDGARHAGEERSHHGGSGGPQRGRCRGG